MRTRVRHRRSRDVEAIPSGLAQPVAEVDVLEVHEVALVESAERIEGIASNHETGTREPTRRTNSIVVTGIVAIGAAPRIRRPDAPEQRMTHSRPQRGEGPSGRVDRSILVEHSGPDRSCSR